jgi:predicted Zn finger-like uncharacterized protein
MIVECTHCKTTYNLDESLIPAGGRKVKCKVCDTVFKVEPPAPAEDPSLDDLFADDTPAGGHSQFSDALNALNEEEAPAARPGAKSGGYQIPGDLAAASAEDLDGEAPAPAAGKSLDLGGGSSFSLDGAKPKKTSGGQGKKKLLFIALGSAMVVLILALAGLYFLKPAWLGLGVKEADKAAEKSPEKAAVENIILDKIRQYYVDNDKVGRIFVVEGVAVNDFDTPKEMIAVEVLLYNHQGQVLLTKRLLAGNTLSLYQLQVLDFDKIEAGLQNDSGIAANNANLPKGGEAPFMVAFANPPANVAEFVVKVVEVKDPAAK